MHEAPGRPAMDVMNDVLRVDGADWERAMNAYLAMTSRQFAGLLDLEGAWERFYGIASGNHPERERPGFELAAFEASGRGA